MTSRKANQHTHKCQVCQSPFKYGDPEPYLMPCLHSICNTCILSDDTEDVNCTICLQRFQKEKSAFEKDAVRVKEIFLSTFEKNPSAMLCTNRNDGNQAKSWCQECEAFLCEVCQMYHNDVKTTRNHEVLPLESVTQTGEGIGVYHAYCKDHTSHPVELYDETCGRFLCYKCLKERHGSCQIEDVDVAFERQKKSDLKDGIESLTEKLADIAQAEAQFQERSSKFESQIKDVETDVRSTFTELKNTINEREESVLQELGSCFKAVKDTNADHLAILAKERVRCQTALEFSDKCLELSAPVALLKMKATIKSRTATCTDVKLPTVWDKESVINFSQVDLGDLKDFISTFGRIYSSFYDETYSDFSGSGTGAITSLKSTQKALQQEIVQLKEHIIMCHKKLKKIPQLIEEGQETGTITFTVKAIADVVDTKFSQRIYVRNIPWYIGIQMNADDNPRNGLGIYLYCRGSKEGSRTVDVVASFSIRSNTIGVKDKTRDMKKTFKETSYGCGFRCFITESSLLDPNNGYITDGAVTIEARIVVEKTTGFSDLNGLLMEECSFVEMDSTIDLSECYDIWNVA